MCTLVVLRRPGDDWPLILGANRDEMIARPWRPPGRHWPDRPEVVAGLDELAQGSWLGINDHGVVAGILNRFGTLGPAPGQRSRGELVLEALDHAVARGASPIGEIRGVAWRGLAARPNGVGRRVESRAITAALTEAKIDASDIGWVYGSASGDGPRDAWEQALLAHALGRRMPVASLAPLLGQHAGLGALRVAAATWTATSGLLIRPRWPAGAEDVTTGPLDAVPRGPGLVHGVARGGTHVALVIDGAPGEAE